MAEAIPLLDFLLGLLLYDVLLEVLLLAVLSAEVIVDLEQCVYYLLMRFEQRRLEQVRQLDVLADDVAGHLEDVLERVDALEEHVALIHDQLEALAATRQSKLTLVLPTGIVA